MISEIKNLKYTRLENIAVIKGGKRIPKGQTFSEIKTNYKYLKVQDINKSIDINLLSSISKDLYQTLKQYELKHNEIIISNAGTIGKVKLFHNYTDNKVILTENAVKVIINSNEVLLEYLRIILQTELLQQQMQREYIQTTIPKLSIDRIKSLLIPLPSKNIQQKIIDIMNNAYKIKNQKEQEAKELLNSIDDYILNKLGINLPKIEEKKINIISINELFGNRVDANYHIQNIDFNNLLLSKNWQYKVLYEIAYLEKGKSLTKTTIKDGDIPVIAGGQSSPYSHDKFTHNFPTITISSSGYAGYIWYHNYPIWASDCSVVYSKNENVISTEFLFYILKILQEFFYTLRKGAVQPHVYIEDFKNLKIPLPLKDIQEEISSKIKEIKTKAKQLQNEAKEILENAKKEVENIILGNQNE